MFEDESTRSDRHEHARQAIQAGIEAAQPRRVLGDTVEYHDDTFRIAGTEYSLDGFDRVLVLG
ncbi:MAG: hypothetical protein V5A32_08345, partial [Halovenus sp.]